MEEELPYPSSQEGPQLVSSWTRRLLPAPNFCLPFNAFRRVWRAFRSPSFSGHHENPLECNFFFLYNHQT